MRILVLGNSQVGALKAGFDDLKGDLSGSLEFSFLAIPEQGLRRFNLSNHYLVIPSGLIHAISSNLKEVESVLDLSVYDSIVVVAGLSPLSPHLLYTNNLNSIRLLSSSVLRASVSSPPRDWNPILRTSQICFDIMKQFQDKAYYLGNVLPGPDVPLVKFINSAPEDIQCIVRCNSRLVRDLVGQCSPFAPSKTLLCPEHALDINQISLKAEFFADGLRSDGSIHGDQWHANRLYGALIINELIASLDR